MFAARRDDDEEPAVAQVLHVCSSDLLAPATRPLGHVDAVLPNNFGVHHTRVLTLRDGSRHVKPVIISDVPDRQLLDEARHTGCFTAIHETLLSHKWYGIVCCLSAQSRRPQILSHPVQGAKPRAETSPFKKTLATHGASRRPQAARVGATARLYSSIAVAHQ